MPGRKLTANTKEGNFVDYLNEKFKSLRKQKQRGHESKKVKEILNINSQHETADTDDAYNSSTVQTPQLSNISSFNTENESSHPNTHTKVTTRP